MWKYDHYATLYNGQSLETTQKYINSRNDKLWYYAYNGIGRYNHRNE